jgi:hypothetical protein
VNSPRWAFVRLFVRQTRLVPSQYATIQAAIDAANAGDEIIVADGTYTGTGNKNLTLRGLPITVRSANGPANCTLDCQGNGRGFRLINTGETPQSMIRGFSIRAGNGEGADGGAIICSDVSPTIENCILINNSAVAAGGLAVLGVSRPTVRSCLIAANSSSVAAGGVHCRETTRPVFANCTIASNTTSGTGGDVYLSASTNVTLTNCLLWA